MQLVGVQFPAGEEAVEREAVPQLNPRGVARDDADDMGLRIVDGFGHFAWPVDLIRTSGLRGMARRASLPGSSKIEGVGDAQGVYRRLGFVDDTSNCLWPS